MSCGLALAVSLLLSDPNVALAAAQPATEAGAPVSLASEPMFMEIINRSAALKAVVDAWSETHMAVGSGFVTGETFTTFKAEAMALSAADMQAHLILEKRGTDGDLKCILRGISEDIPRKVEAVEKAETAPARAIALSELSYLLNDNVEVITSPPAPEV